MTVAISCNLSDGVILGVDSAVTVAAGEHVKIWDNAEKLFQLSDKPVGAAIYGLAGFGDRSVGSYFREFEQSNPAGVLTSPNDVSVVVEALRHFLYTAYYATIVPAIEAAGVNFNDLLQAGNAPTLGVIVGGFSAGQYLPELWQVVIPYSAAQNSGIQTFGRGVIGVSWYSMYMPIVRYINGYDQEMFLELVQHVEGLLGRPFTADERTAFNSVFEKYQYKVSFSSMPIEQGIEYVRFLVDLAIKHFHFSSGFAHQPFTEKVVGGRARLGVVTYKADRFRILD